MTKLEKFDHKYIAMIYECLSETPEFLRIRSKKETQSVINQLNRNNSSLYSYTNRCLIAPPFDNRRTYGWHHEVFYTIPKSKYIQT